MGCYCCTRSECLPSISRSLKLIVFCYLCAKGSAQFSTNLHKKTVLNDALLSFFTCKVIHPVMDVSITVSDMYLSHVHVRIVLLFLT